MSDVAGKDLTIISSIPAISVNKVYVTITGGIGRLTFVEAFSPEMETPRIATALALEGLIGLRDAITEALALYKENAESVSHARFN